MYGWTLLPSQGSREKIEKCKEKEKRRKRHLCWRLFAEEI